MDTTTSALLTGLIVTGGQVANGKGISIKVVIAVLFLAMILSLMSNANDTLARKFGILILVGATFAYAPAIVDKLGLGKK